METGGKRDREAFGHPSSGLRHPPCHDTHKGAVPPTTGRNRPCLFDLSRLCLSVTHPQHEVISHPAPLPQGRGDLDPTALPPNLPDQGRGKWNEESRRAVLVAAAGLLPARLPPWTGGNPYGGTINSILSALLVWHSWRSNSSKPYAALVYSKLEMEPQVAGPSMS
jgi:hypothetical protein